MPGVLLDLILGFAIDLTQRPWSVLEVLNFAEHRLIITSNKKRSTLR